MKLKIIIPLEMWADMLSTGDRQQIAANLSTQNVMLSSLQFEADTG
jgi:hypothetical protein